MDKDKVLLVVSIIVSVTFLTCSIMISVSLNHLSNSFSSVNQVKIVQEEQKSIMTFKEAASYLHISPAKLDYLISPYRDASIPSIPFLKIDDQYIFTKSGIDKWLETCQETHNLIN